MKRDRARTARFFFLMAAAVVVAIQIVPYGRNGRSNPPVVREPVWDSTETKAMAKRACFDCHSNETLWPWYSTVAPASWLVVHDVAEGRDALNFSEWQGRRPEGADPGKIKEEIAEGEMPPFQYRLAHPAARLTDAEKSRLIEGLAITVNQSRVRSAPR